MLNRWLSLTLVSRTTQPENILLAGDGHVLLTDFGLSKVAVESDTICGSAEYMAPEIVSEQKCWFLRGLCSSS